MDWRVQNDLILFLEPSGKTRSTRPATEQEIELWREHKSLRDTLTRVEATFDADMRSALAANEAYRAQQVRLADFITRKFPHMAPAGNTEDFVDVALELLGNYAIVKDGGATGAATAHATLLGSDAYAVPGSVGANPTGGSGNRPDFGTSLSADRARRATKKSKKERNKK